MSLESIFDTVDDEELTHFELDESSGSEFRSEARMGAFGTGPFDNDDALDLLGECVDSPTRTLRAALQAVQGDYVEVDVGGRAWAAAEIVALAFGRGELTDLPSSAAELVLRIKPNDALRALALRAIERLGREGSELAELWAETPDDESFRARLEDLRGRLVDAAAGPTAISKPKKGDVLALVHDGFVFAAQTISAREVVVFEGALTEADGDLRALTGRAGHRVAVQPSVVLGARVLGSAPIARAFRGTKQYVRVDEFSVQIYGVGPVRARELDWVGFDEVRDLDVCQEHDRVELAAIAHGERRPLRAPSPEQRLASLRERMADVWARERERLAPHPLGSPVALRCLFGPFRTPADKLVMQWSSRVLGHTPPFTTLEDAKSPWPTSWQEDRDAFAFAGLVALWVEGFGRDVWPSDLPIPDPPQPALLPEAVQSARVLAPQLHSVESGLRQLWEAGPDGGAVFRHHLDALDAALRRAAEKHAWTGERAKVWIPRNLGFPLSGPEFEADLDAVIASLDD